MRRVCLNSVYEMAKSDERVTFIGSDLGPDTLSDFQNEMPDRFFMEGISEQHVVGMAAGMAMEGFVPYVNTIAPFLTRRCYEQIVIDACLHDLPIRLIGNGGGVVYAPLGPTHLATEDIAILRCLPNMTIIAPCDAEEMNRLMPQTLDWPHPMYIRLAKGGDKIISKEASGFEIGKAIMMREPDQCLFVTTGVMTQIALDAADKLAKEGVDCGVLHMHTIKPLDEKMLLEALSQVSVVVTVEEHTRIGGLGSAVLEFINDVALDSPPIVKRIGIPDQFAGKYGSQDCLLAHWGIDVDGLYGEMKKAIKRI